jgi:hypothetical protein
MNTTYPQYVNSTHVNSEADDILYSGSMESVRNRMDSRRAIAEAQVRADDIKSELCDLIRVVKMGPDGLSARIADLETTDRQMYDYIRNLEFVRAGIWCAKCSRAKSAKKDVPVPPGAEQLAEFLAAKLPEPSEEELADDPDDNYVTISATQPAPVLSRCGTVNDGLTKVDHVGVDMTRVSQADLETLRDGYQTLKDRIIEFYGQFVSLENEFKALQGSITSNMSVTDGAPVHQKRSDAAGASSVLGTSETMITATRSKWAHAAKSLSRAASSLPRSFQSSLPPLHPCDLSSADLLM